MILRRAGLPAGWYPQDTEEIRRFFQPLSLDPASPGAVAALAPHAGWRYSGRIAARSVAALERDAETLVVIGGHLPAGMPPLFAEEDAAATPLGDLEIDREFRSRLWDTIGGMSDRFRDNTVEVLLPMVRYLFPVAKLVWVRLPAEARSFEAGKAIAETAGALKRKIAVLGSTDLTHYGDNYGFSPHGSGSAALEWVTTVNDRAFIDAALAGSQAEVLERAVQDHAACSAGAVLACLGYARAMKASGGELLAYATSAAAGEVPDSFVGYASIVWRRCTGGCTGGYTGG
ncbi:MAG: AmmeMemoRadiSam system protein B [Treponema sp.]|jgi:AmmeMemoRadiSam system protein B|nr:AmmeMemoRadiSam system protein B [Treponema sp.]